MFAYIVVYGCVYLCHMSCLTPLALVGLHRNLMFAKCLAVHDGIIICDSPLGTQTVNAKPKALQKQRMCEPQLRA